MKCPVFFQFVQALALSSSLLVLTPDVLRAQETNVADSSPAEPAAEQEISPELMRSFLHLQEQVYATQLAVERARHEADTAAARNSEVLNKRLEILEDAVSQASKENTAAIVESNRQIQESNSHMMLMAGVFALIGFLALALTGWLQWKTVSRLTGQPSDFPALLAQGYAPTRLGPGPERPVNTQLKDAMWRLEHRIAEMESSSHASGVEKMSPTPLAEDRSAQSASSDNLEIVSLMREGEELLEQGEVEKAIEHFDRILLKHQGHPEVLLQKGTALERLRKDQEAIECYDLAIRADQNLTMAYLHKGGLFNRMERFSEAMECYEQALRIQEGRPAA